jgi:hypothetical protein
VHASSVEHASPSSHAVPSGDGDDVHAPVAGLHPFDASHGPTGGHTIGAPPVQPPAWQVSLWVQWSPSSQATPSGRAGFEHAPVVGLHVPAAWHWSDGPQTIGLAPVQAPPWHVSVCVQASPSLHAVPFGAVGFEHAPLVGLHAPAS